MNDNSNQGNLENKKDEVELEKDKEHIIVEIVEYVPNAVISRTIIKKSTGNVIATSVSQGEEIYEKTIPYDNYIQVIDGVADLSIGKKSYHLKTGRGIVIPANALQCFYANQQFKIISTIIKNTL